MPAAATNAFVTWGVYLGVCGFFLLMSAPYLSHLRTLSEAAAGERVMQGVCSILAGVGHGVSANFSFGSKGGESMAMSGTSVSLHTGIKGIAVDCGVPLPTLTLTPGVQYTARPGNGSLEVLAHV